MKIDLSRVYECINTAYHPYLDDFRSVQIYKGGGSAGKSRFIAQSRIYNTILIPGFDGLVIRNVNGTNRKSTFPELKTVIKDFGMRDLFDIKKSKGEEEINCLINGNQIIFSGLDDQEKIKSVTTESGGLCWIWVEEASEISEADFNQLLIRLRGVGAVPKHIILSFNPIDSDHWIKGRFFDTPLGPREGFICETTHRDNAYLTAADRARLEAFKYIDYYYYQVYCLNEWGSLRQSKVFHNLKVYDFDIPDHRFKNLRAGEDFGWNHPQVFVRTGWLDGELYVYDEIAERKMINTDFIRLIQSSGHPPEMLITCDSEDPGAIQENNDAGLIATGAQKGPGSVDRGVKWLKRLPAIHIHKSRCPVAARQFSHYKHRETRDKILDNQYVEIEDDAIDAVRYANEDLIGMSESGEGYGSFPRAYA